MQLISPCRKMAFEIFSQRITYSRTKIALRCLGDDFGVNKTVTCRFVIEVETVKISVFFVHNRKCCRCRTGSRDSRESKYRKACFLSGSFGCVQCFSATHAEDHVCAAFFCMCCQFFHSGVCTVGTEKNRVYDFNLRIFCGHISLRCH